jgi:hypothetical protein
VPVPRQYSSSSVAVRSGGKEDRTAPHCGDTEQGGDKGGAVGKEEADRPPFVNAMR